MITSSRRAQRFGSTLTALTTALTATLMLAACGGEGTSPRPRVVVALPSAENPDGSWSGTSGDFSLTLTIRRDVNNFIVGSADYVLPVTGRSTADVATGTYLAIRSPEGIPTGAYDLELSFDAPARIQRFSCVTYDGHICRGSLISSNGNTPIELTR